MHVDQHLVAVRSIAGRGQFHHPCLVGGGAEGVIRDTRGVITIPLSGAERSGRRVDVGNVAVRAAEGVLRNRYVVVLAIGRGGCSDRGCLRVTQADAAHCRLQGNVLGVTDTCTAGTGTEIAETAFAAAGKRNADGQCKQEEQTNDEDTAQRKPPRNTATRGAAVST